MRHAIAALMLFVALSRVAFSQGGPPFRSDDPGTPGNGHWEINIAAIGEQNKLEGLYSLPNLDINYGAGGRIQLKYEMPFGVRATRDSRDHITGGAGTSVAGVKYRFYEHRPPDEDEANFALSMYPQLQFSTVPSSERRRISDPAQLYLPLECSARISPLLVSTEVGRWLSRRDVPGAWVEAVVIGREFSRRTELFTELYHRTEAGPNSVQVHDLTISLGGRRTLDRGGSKRLIAMLGHSLLPSDSSGTRPEWVAYVGIQLLLSGKKN